MLRRLQENLRCSFCSKARSKTRKMIAGPNVYICNECVEICREILDDDKQDKPTNKNQSISE